MNWNQCIWDKRAKLKNLSPSARVLHTTSKQVFKRLRKDETGYERSKSEKCTCKACKTTVYIVKYTNLWRSCGHRRGGYLSSLITMTTAASTSEICILKKKRKSFCTLCTCIFHFCTFRSRYRGICDVKITTLQPVMTATWALEDKLIFKLLF